MLRYLCSLAAGLGLCMGAHAAVVTSAYTALGGDAWSVRLGVQNDGTPGVITGFTVYFDAASYQGLSLRQGVAGWDTLVLPGDLALPADGFLDSAVLSPANALGLGAQASGWELDFRFSTPGALPGALAFDIVDSNFAVQTSGRTMVSFVNPPTAVPEPGSAPLLAVALLAAALASARRRVTSGGSDGSPHLVLRRGARMGFATVALAAGLAGCGGGGQDPDTQALASATAQKRALAASTALPSASSSVTVQAITQTAQRRISRTVFEFDYRLTVKNSGGALLGVALELQAAGPGTTVVDGMALAGDLAAGATVQPGDTVTVRHDRSLPFAPDKLVWRVRVAEPVLQGTAAVGAALANANVSVTDTTRSNVCAESRIVSNGTGGFTCTVLAGKTAPFLVTVTEPFGAYPPMVSVVGSTPAPGTALVVNATPLTTALVAQLAPDQLATSVVANPALIDLAALASITRNVLAQIAPVLAAVGAPVGYDPFSTPIVAATPQQAGNTADQVIELLRFTVVAGVPQISSVDNPAASVPIAGANTVNPPLLPPVSPAVLGLVDAMRTVTGAFQACFALPVASRVLAVDNTIAATSGGRLVTAMAPACNAIAHPAHLHNGFQFG